MKRSPSIGKVIPFLEAQRPKASGFERSVRLVAALVFPVILVAWVVAGGIHRDEPVSIAIVATLAVVLSLGFARATSRDAATSPSTELHALDALAWVLGIALIIAFALSFPF